MILSFYSTRRDQEQTRVTLEAMQAYFRATAQARPHRERQRLAREWLKQVRYLRQPPH